MRSLNTIAPSRGIAISQTKDWTGIATGLLNLDRDKRGKLGMLDAGYTNKTIEKRITKDRAG